MFNPCCHFNFGCSNGPIFWSMTTPPGGTCVLLTEPHWLLMASLLFRVDVLPLVLGKNT